MSRSKRLLILLAVLAAACAAAFAALHWQHRQEQLQTSGQAVLEIDPDAVTSLAWTCGDTSLAFARGEEGGWSYPEDEAFPVDPEAMEALLSPFAPFSAAFVIEDVEDETQYGLDDPACSITIATDAQTWEIRLGDTSAVDGQRYVSFGDGRVYLAAADPLEQYDITLRDCILNDEAPEMEKAASIAFSGSEDWEAFYQEDNAAYTYCADDVYFTRRDGATLPLDTSRVEDYLSALSSLGLDNYVTYDAAQEDLAQYGLDEPELTVTVDYTTPEDESGTFTLHISRDPEEKAEAEAKAAGADGETDGETDEEETVTAYARVGDSAIVYSISAEEYNSLMAASYDDLRHRKLLTADFEDVQRVDVTLDGATETFTAEGKGDGRTWTWDGEEVEFSALQIAIEDLTADSFTSETPSQRQEVALTVYLDHETFPQVEIALYRYDGSHCLAVVDGTPACLVSRADAVNLMETVRSIVLGGEESGG